MLLPVLALLAWRLARGERPCSANTGAYCTARAKIPEAVCQRLLRETGRHVQQQAPDPAPLVGSRRADRHDLRVVAVAGEFSTPVPVVRLRPAMPRSTC